MKTIEIYITPTIVIIMIQIRKFYICWFILPRDGNLDICHFIIAKNIIVTPDGMCLKKWFKLAKLSEFRGENYVGIYVGLRSAEEKMVFFYQNWSHLLWEKKLFLWSKIFFEIQGWRPRIWKHFEITKEYPNFVFTFFCFVFCSKQKSGRWFLSTKS